MVSEAGCPLVCGGSGLKPFTPIGVAMLGTGAVLMPGGVLVPAGGRCQHQQPPLRLLSRMGSKGRGVIPEEGVRGAATSPLTLKAAICCIWAAAMAAMGFRQVPCAAAIRAACCCMIFRKERGKKGKVSEWQREGGSRGGKISIPALYPRTGARRDKCHPLPDPGTGGGLGDTKRGDTWDRCTLQPCHPHLGAEAFWLCP